MAAQKSGDGLPLANAVEQRPGSYAKISGARRARKGNPRPASVSGSSPPADVELEGSAGVLDDGDAVDIAQVNSASRSSPRPPRRAPGPLGMGEERIDDEGSQPAPPTEAQPGGARVVSSRLKVIEINPADEGSEVDEPRQPKLALPPPQRAPIAEDDVGAEWPAAAATSSALAIADEASRPSLSSVFDARPSLRPSPPPPVPKSSPAWWLVVSLLSAIIAAAGIVALRESLDSEPVPRAPVTATRTVPGPAATPAGSETGESVASGEPVRADDAVGERVELADAGAQAGSVSSPSPQPKRAPTRPRAAVATSRQEQPKPARTPVPTVATLPEQPPATPASDEDGTSPAEKSGGAPAGETVQPTQGEGPLPANPYADP